MFRTYNCVPVTEDNIHYLRRLAEELNQGSNQKVEFSGLSLYALDHLVEAHLLPHLLKTTEDTMTRER